MQCGINYLLAQPSIKIEISIIDHRFLHPI